MSIKERIDVLPLKEGMAEKPEEDNTELYRVRAEVRNSLRGFVERSPFLSRLFRTIHVPAVTVDDLQADEEAYIQVLAQKMCRHGVSDCLDEACEYARDARNLKDLAPEHVGKEEKARYLAAKVSGYLQSGRYPQILQLFESIPMRFGRDESLIRFFVYSVETPIYNFLRSLLVSRNGGEFLRAYMELGTVMPLEDFDVSDLSEELREDEAFQTSLKSSLGNLVGVHPRIYKAVKDLSMRLGILDEENLETQPEITDRVYGMVLHYVAVDYEAYETIRDLLDEAGLMTKDEANASEILFEGIIHQLAQYMAKSPRLYKKMRDRWVNAGYLYQDEADDSEKVRRALDRFLIQRIEDHPRLYQHFRRMAKFYGVEVGDEELLKRTVKSKEESLKESLWPNYTNEEISHFMDMHSVQCERLAEKHERMIKELLEKLEFTAQDFERQFPHIAKNGKSLLGKLLS